jgi:hypothetical protein
MALLPRKGRRTMRWATAPGSGLVVSPDHLQPRTREAAGTADDGYVRTNCEEVPVILFCSSVPIRAHPRSNQQSECTLAGRRNPPQSPRHPVPAAASEATSELSHRTDGTSGNTPTPFPASSFPSFPSVKIK